MAGRRALRGSTVSGRRCVRHGFSGGVWCTGRLQGVKLTAYRCQRTVSGITAQIPFFPQVASLAVSNSSKMQDAPVLGAQSPMNGPSRVPERLRILMLEDVPMDAELVEYELQRSSIPFDARCVDTREAFLQELEDFRPDLILSDFTLPRFDGMTALSLARERAPAVPFLIVTGSVNEETAVGCMKAGATDYLLKSNLARIGPAIEAALARVESKAEKARAEEALRRSEANLRAIFNTSLQ